MNNLVNVDFSWFLNKTFKFYGVDGYHFRVDDNVFEVVEDPDDGYRSAMNGVYIVTDKEILKSFKNKYHIVDVTCELGKGEMDTLKFIDGAGHVWLEIGTDIGDSYYPSFVFDYNINKRVITITELLLNI